VYFLPVVSSAVAVGLVWSWIYAKDAGLLNYMITNLGGEPVNWLSTRNALYSVVVVNIWAPWARRHHLPRGTASRPQ
jgi:multiple sugar transport system permease protein